MKSKFKGNGKNRILAVIASAVMFCLVVLLIIVTRKTDAVADTSVIINGKEYSQDNKMKILEIISEIMIIIWKRKMSSPKSMCRLPQKKKLLLFHLLLRKLPEN